MQLFINNWASQLALPISSTAQEIQVPAEAAALLTGLGAGDHYLLTLAAADYTGSETALEIVRVTAATAAGALTVERGQEATLVADWPAGARVEARYTAGAAAAAALALAAHQQDIEPHPQYVPPVTSVNARAGDVSVLELPQGGTDGQVLVKVGAADGSAAWAAPQSGGGSGGAAGSWQVRGSGRPMEVGVANSTAISSATLSANRLCAHPFRIAEQMTVARCGMRNNSLGSSVIGRAGIYSNDAAGSSERPGSLLFGGTYTANLNGGFFGYPDSTAGGETITLEPGVTYWAVYGATTTGFGCSGVAVAGQENSMGFDTDYNSVTTELYVSDSSGALPAVLSGTAWAESRNTARIRFLLQRQL